MLGRSFYDRPALDVARDLVGRVLVHRRPEGLTAGRIVETEAYIGPDDRASHASRGKTRRNAAMFGPPGHAYVYLVYGMHWCLNLVTGPEGAPAAVLLRAVEPVEGIERMRARRTKARRDQQLTSGPGRLCQAFAIDGSLDGADLCAADSTLYVEGRGRRAGVLVTAPRVGVSYAGDWADKPFRFYEDDCAFVSVRRRGAGGGRPVGLPLLHEGGRA